MKFLIVLKGAVAAVYEDEAIRKVVSSRWGIDLKLKNIGV